MPKSSPSALRISGDTIIGLKIGNGPVNNLVVGTHHGNEYGATEVTRAFAADRGGESDSPARPFR